MNRTVLAAVVALSIPAAALADERRELERPAPAPAPYRADVRRDASPLERLVSRWEAVQGSPAARRELPRLEAELAVAFDRAVATARAACAPVQPVRYDEHARTQGRPGFEHGQGWQVPPQDRAARFHLDRLLAARADFARQQGRFGWRAMQVKHAAVDELVAFASAGYPRELPGPRPLPQHGTW